MNASRAVVLLLAFASIAFAAAAGTATITTASDVSRGWVFSANSATGDPTVADVTVEPWDQPAWCGNLVDLGEVAFESVTSAPAAGYLWDEEGFEDCKYVNSTHIYVFKTRDGKYAKVKVINAQNSPSSNGFVNSITFQYVYQHDGTRNLAAGSGAPFCPGGLIAGLAALTAIVLYSKYA